MRTPAWLTRIGADPRDNEDLRQKKSLLVLLAVLVLPVSIIWGTCYLAFGSPVGIIPFVYFVVSLGSLLIFARTKRFSPFLTTQLLDILLTTTVGQMFAGGFLPAGGVGLWGILAPLGALVFLEVRQAIRWFIGFLCAFVLLGIAGELFFPPAPVPHWFTTTMLALNIVGAGAIAFIVLASFANQRNAALAALRVEQSRSEALLTNVLPSTIAERLKVRAGRSPTTSSRPRSCSPTSSTSRRSRSACRRPRSSRPSTASSPCSTAWSSSTDSRRSRRSGIATWPRRASPIRAPITRSEPPCWRSTCAQRWTARRTAPAHSSCGSASTRGLSPPA
jgi:hypothetical protein